MFAAAAASAETLSIDKLPGWQDDRLNDWVRAWEQSCAAEPDLSTAKPLFKALSDGERQLLCRNLPRAETADQRRWVQRHFRAVKISAEAFVTGYFEPVLDGRRRKTIGYPAPVYGQPPELARVLQGSKRFASRGEIMDGALADRGLELAWLEPVDAFFLHIQGSGVIRFPDGEQLRAGYANHNGWPYHAIGRDLLRSGAIPRQNMSMQAIAEWLRENRQAADELMRRNNRYIFFRRLAGDGPIGASGAVLTAERSLAVDFRHIAYGLPIWVDLGPDPRGSEGRLRQLMVAQDTGSAIRGQGRADFYWGSGSAAGSIAGRMQSTGVLYVLLPVSRTD